MLSSAAWLTSLALMGGLAGFLAYRTRRDAVTLLSLYLFLLFAIQARWVVRPLGGIGTPALLVGLVAAGWWVAAKSVLPDLARGPQPIRALVLFYAWFMGVGYAVAHMRPLTDLEVSGSHRAAITWISLVGVALLTADGTQSRERLDTLLQRLVGGGVLLAAVGIAQFFLRFDAAAAIRWPGLGLNKELTGIATRSLFNRPAGTAMHPIEFGVVLAIVLPLALHYALHASTSAEKTRRWMSVGVISLAIPMSVSRTGVLGLAVGMAGLSLAWSWRRRLNALAGAFVFTVITWAAIPGLVGTIRGLFTRAGEDGSVQARLSRVPRVLDLAAETPWLGRGLGTFSRDEYFLLDNQYFKTLIEHGTIGVVVVLAFLIAGISSAWSIKRKAVDGETAHLAVALAASIAIYLPSIATFDAFFYRIFTGVLFILLGSAGALWRLEHEQTEVAGYGQDISAQPTLPVRPITPAARPNRTDNPFE